MVAHSVMSVYVFSHMTSILVFTSYLSIRDSVVCLFLRMSNHRMDISFNRIIQKYVQSVPNIHSYIYGFGTSKHPYSLNCEQIFYVRHIKIHTSLYDEQNVLQFTYANSFKLTSYTSEE